jgi:hypothetical protein
LGSRKAICILFPYNKFILRELYTNGLPATQVKAGPLRLISLRVRLLLGFPERTHVVVGDSYVVVKTHVVVGDSHVVEGDSVIEAGSPTTTSGISNHYVFNFPF